MRGRAQVYLLHSPEVEQDCYSTLVKRLEKRFGGYKQKPLWASQLENRKRRLGESIAELGDDIRRLTRKAYDNLGTAAQDMLGMQQLLKSTSSDLRYQCLIQGCDTVEKAVEMIQTYENIHDVTGHKGTC